MRVLRPCRQLLSSSRHADQLASCYGRCIHTTAQRNATPIPHPPAPGPPPKAPTPSNAFADDRVLRKKKQAELVKIGQTLRANPAKPGTALLKRFWKDVSVKETPDGFQVMLDTRPVRRPMRHVLVIPRNKPHLATAIALEWDQLVSAHQAIKQVYIPLTSLTSRSLDIQEADLQENRTIRDSIVKMLIAYLTTDTLLCWVPEKSTHNSPSSARGSDIGPSLKDLQKRTADPIINFMTKHIWPGVELNPALSEDSILPAPQPEMTTEVIRGWISGLPPFELAALERAVLATKSLVVSARLLVDWSQHFAPVWKGQENRQRFSIEDAAEACNLEVTWQTRQWGEVEDTHDVDKEDIRRQLGGAILACS